MIDSISTAISRLNGVNIPLSEFTPAVYQALREKGLICTYTHHKGVMVRLARQRTRQQHKTIATLTKWQGNPHAPRIEQIKVCEAKISGIYNVVLALGDTARPITLFRQDSLNATCRRGWVEVVKNEEGSRIACLTTEGQAILKAIRLAPLK